MTKVDLLNLLPDELCEFVRSELSEPKYKATQIFEWLHKGAQIDEMTTLSLKTRKLLDEKAFVNLPTVVKKLQSQKDGTIKYLFSLHDTQRIESVFMRYKHGNTICISSQAGCRMGCKFCASTIGGLSRNLEPSEMLGQIISVQKDTGERISNVVMMGIGEPLDNFDNTVKFLKLVNEKGGLNIGYRHISVSTSGLVDRIYDLAKCDFPITLSISLHASDNEERSNIMPVNKKWPIERLLTACREYFEVTGRRISFEYTLIKGKNDSVGDAYKLSEILKKYLGNKIPIHVNLIPLNEVKLQTSTRQSVNLFKETLEKNGITATLRRTLGPDINASCGQLRQNSETVQ